MLVALTVAALFSSSMFVSAMLLTPSFGFSNGPFSTSSPKVILRPFQTAPGKNVKVTGINFTPNSAITISFAGGSIGSTQSNSTGGFSTLFAVPISIQNGLYPVGATDALGVTALAALNVTLSPKIALTATSHIVGGSVSISGSGFPPTSSVQVYFGSFLETITSTNATGGFSTSFKVPVVPNSIYIVEAISGAYFSTKSFPVSAHLTATPSSPVPVGSTITVSGTGFSANTQVSFNMGSIMISTKATTLADGTFSIGIIVPNVPKGQHTLAASDQSYNTAQVRVSVSN
jgi:hypothetical protein